MRFRKWIESETGSTDRYPDAIGDDPDERGLVRPQYLRNQPPESAHANQLFGRDYMSGEVNLTYLLNPPGEIPAIGPESGEPINHGIVRYDSPHGSHRYVFYKEGQAVSALQIVTKDKKNGHVANVFTHPSWRRGRLATQLLNQAKSDFKISFPTERSDLADKWIDGQTNR